MSRARLFAVAMCSIGFVRAQSTGLFGPVAGFTFDQPTHSIRAVIGALGSASLGPPINGKLDSAFVAPRQNYAIARRSGQVLFVAGLDSAQSTLSALPGSSSVPEGAVWSDDGSAVVLYSHAGGWIQIFTGFPGSISPGVQTSVAALGGSLSSVALDPHGQRIAIGISGNPGGVFEIANGQSFSPRMATSNPIALAYSEDSSELFCLDGSANQISGITLSSSAIQTWPAGADDAIAIKPAIDATNRKVLYVAGRNSRSLLVYDRSSNQISTSIALSFSPWIIEPFGLNGYLLTRRSGGADPLWSFISAAEPVVYFVPAAPVPESGPHREAH